jgi:hypothetical protein
MKEISEAEMLEAIKCHAEHQSSLSTQLRLTFGKRSSYLRGEREDKLFTQK